MKKKFQLVKKKLSADDLKKISDMSKAGTSTFITGTISQVVKCNVCDKNFQARKRLTYESLRCWKVYVTVKTLDAFEKLKKCLQEAQLPHSKIAYVYNSETRNPLMAVIYYDNEKDAEKCAQKFTFGKTDVVRGCRNMRLLYPNTAEWEKLFEIMEW